MKRVWLFDVVVWSVLCYGVEVWGWEGCATMESMHERFLRWVFELGWNCPGYMVREEVRRVRLEVRMRERAWRFERKLKCGIANELAGICMREMERRTRDSSGSLVKWERERLRVRQEWKMNERIEWSEIEEKMVEYDEGKRWEKIVESKFNRWYKFCRSLADIPEYLVRMKKEYKWQRMIRFRMGEGIKESMYWKKEEERLCRVCEYEVESWEYVLEGCVNSGMDEERGVCERVQEILNESGRGVGFLRDLELRRESKNLGV